MRRSKSMEAIAVRKWRLSHILFAIAAVYLIMIGFKFYHILELAGLINDDRNLNGIDRHVEVVGVAETSRPVFVSSSRSFHRRLDGGNPPPKPGGDPVVLPTHQKSMFSFDHLLLKRRQWGGNRTELERMAHEAWVSGMKAWEEVRHYEDKGDLKPPALLEGKQQPCPSSVSMGKNEIGAQESLMFLPCGLDVGSSITVIGTPHRAHEEYVPHLARLNQSKGVAMVSQFMVELQGLKAVDGEEPPKILHFNPRLKGDWSGRPVIEHNTCLRMRWGKSMRCDGIASVHDDDTDIAPSAPVGTSVNDLHMVERLIPALDRYYPIESATNDLHMVEKLILAPDRYYFVRTAISIVNITIISRVDGFIQCEKWFRSDVVDSKESKSTSWLKRFIGRAKKPELTWPFPFVEGRLFVLTFQAAMDGYHVSVGGRHITSFPYRPGFTIEDTASIAIKGNVDVHSVFASSLPSSHPSFSRQQVLELSESWKSSSLPKQPIVLFIGILSAANHFAERMAIRRTWMQYSAIKLSNVVALFFVALSPMKEVNVVLKREAEYFGDIIILPFIDRYELVVLKTVAICEYGVKNLTAAYIMKCDDDTFVRLDVVLREVINAAGQKSLYMGNINVFHRPLRNGKWAVTYEEWPEKVYPPYADGPGYIISSDIAKFIVSKHTNHTLSMFKMEDVSMGMWVEEFNASTPVRYSHNWKFCQYGCMDGYYTSHYQSPRQMICLWDKLARGRARCCNFR